MANVAPSAAVDELTASSESPLRQTVIETDLAPGARQLERGIVATWWYTAGGTITFMAMIVMMWVLMTRQADAVTAAPAVIGVGGCVWIAATLPLLFSYRHRGDDAPSHRWWRVGVALTVSIAYGVSAGLTAQSVLLAAAPAAAAATLLHWSQGVRSKVVALITLGLILTTWVDTTQRYGDVGSSWWVPAVLTISLPLMITSSLWWWDVLVTLDRARLAEGRLAATQERLRVATDVHDLQGHYLQVIALHLELVDRLLPGDPVAAKEQVRVARASVNDATQGTRELAAAIRALPVADEIENARDLLLAAGLEVAVSIEPEARAEAPVCLGPVVRETTTNVLRHGGGNSVNLLLARRADGWRYEMRNDMLPHTANARVPERVGTGLSGMQRRVAEAGGTVEVVQGDGEFAVVVSVPAEPGGSERGSAA